MKNHVFTVSALVRGIRLALPMALGVATYGVVFGVLSRQAGLSEIEALFMSATVFAGASQFVALDIWAQPLPILALVVTTLAVNLRHVLMGAVLRDRLSGLTRGQTLASLFFMTDENWAYCLTRWRQGDRDPSLLAGTGICIFLAWTLSTVAGSLMSSGIDPVKWGMDFSFTAIFIFLATGLWQGKNDLLPWIVAGSVAVLGALYLPGKWYILAGGIAGSLAGAFCHE